MACLGGVRIGCCMLLSSLAFHVPSALFLCVQLDLSIYFPSRFLQFS